MIIKSSKKFRRSESGSTLIEALISILLLSLGLLGVAGLQMNALAFQKSSWATHRTAELSIDISERMRSNPVAASDGNYTYTANYATAKAAVISSNGCRTSTSACSTAQIANDDLAEWLAKAQNTLPGGAVRLSSTADSSYAITSMYLDKDFIDSATGALAAPNVCTSSSSGIDLRNCCPAAASVPNGVKCSTITVIL